MRRKTIGRWSRKGFAPIILLLITGSLIAGTGLYFYLHKNNRPAVFSENAAPSSPSTTVNTNETSTAPDTNSSSSYGVKVLYTNDYFTPKLLTVSAGSRCAFKNTTDIPLWTASDPHPTHTDYPRFDAKRGYSSNEVYIF